ncbi:hypothetical protein ALC60_04702 [Trachymyrmex zeteki]|uniref:Uncharacterized protein n=1 Tax=Mycetomoellerius zeteki TaxID=64791 RepID=A0A151X7E4_9HYME|nr:hypothetical protein ALC60_04702 [Trachymyrmex zeteki]
MRVILCPHEIGRNTRQDNEATRRPSSLTEVHPFREARTAREKRVRKKMIG